MSDHVYKVVEIVGSSSSGLEDAITNAVQRAGRTLENLDWFEVAQIRGHLEEGGIAHYQVTLKIGFTLND
jgi:flavin-binding protein dodecin